MRALHTAATGMMAQELNVQVISNNIANMRTTGYKRQRAEFQDLLYQHVRRVGTQTSDQGNILPAGIELGSGVKTVGTPRVMSQGTLLPTVEGIRRRDPRRRLLPDPAAGRPHRLHPRRLVRARRAGPHRHRAGLCGAARHHGAAELDRHHHQPAGPGVGHAAGPDRADAGRADRALACSSTRPACRRIGDNLYHRDAGLRHAAATASPTSTASATCSRAISNRPTSRRSTKSPT